MARTTKLRRAQQRVSYWRAKVRKLGSELRRAQKRVEKLHKAIERAETALEWAEVARKAAKAKPAKKRKGATKVNSEKNLLDAVSINAGRFGMASAFDVRREAKLPRAAFDALALSLMRRGKLILHHHDHPTSLTEEARQGAIWDGKTCYHAMALPRASR